MVPVPWTDAKGVERTGFDFDPYYEPALPAGAVRGDIRKQEYCKICHVPRYFYVDQTRTCAQCGREFVFSAKEQKYWYETLRFYFSSVARRCVSCRRKRRSERSLQQQLAHARAEQTRTPEDPGTQLALAEAIVRYVQQRDPDERQPRPLQAAIAAARKARRLLKDHGEHPTRELRESAFWEGMAQALAERPDAARELLAEFVSADIAGRRLQALAKEARSWLERHALTTTRMQSE
jgi:hypothetical protein